MSITRAELLLHPVRMRILQAVASQGPTTARQIADILDDIPSATLYRHLGRLVEAELLHVIAETPVRGAIEKTYALPDAGALLPPDHLQDASAEAHFRSFLSFVAAQLSTLSRYLDQDAPALCADGLSYQTTPLYLSDAEYTDLIARLQGVIAAASDHTPTPERRLRLVSLTTMPAMDDTNT